jgi:hypothetical protein
MSVLSLDGADKIIAGVENRLLTCFGPAESADGRCGASLRHFSSNKDTGAKTTIWRQPVRALSFVDLS